MNQNHCTYNSNFTEQKGSSGHPQMRDFLIKFESLKKEKNSTPYKKTFQKDHFVISPCSNKQKMNLQDSKELSLFNEDINELDNDELFNFLKQQGIQKKKKKKKKKKIGGSRYKLSEFPIFCCSVYLCGWLPQKIL